MKDLTLSNRVLQKLIEFESMEDIQPSAGWNDSLKRRMSSEKTRSASGYMSARFIITVLFIVLINLGFVLNTIYRNSHQNLYKNKDLETLSQELLINPVSIKN